MNNKMDIQIDVPKMSNLIDFVAWLYYPKSRLLQNR
jgi:hypothetical protein